MPAKMEIEEFLSLYGLLKRTDSLDEITYVNASTKARFIDPELGEYWAKPSEILYGSVLGHPAKRGKRAAETRFKNFGTKKLGGRKKKGV